MYLSLDKGDHIPFLAGTPYLIYPQTKRGLLPSPRRGKDGLYYGMILNHFLMFLIKMRVSPAVCGLLGR